MERQVKRWKPGYAATAIAIAVPLLVLVFSYRPAVNWFNALNNVRAAKETPSSSPSLPVTGMKPVPEGPGFPWWALVVILSVLFMTLFWWLSGYKNVLTASSHATAHAAERRARSYTFDADVYGRLNDDKNAQRLSGLAGRLARTALVLKGTSKVLNRIESAGAQLDLPPVSDGDAANIDAQDYKDMPPRLDSLTED